VILFRVVIVVVHIDAELDLFDHDLLLMLLGLALFLFLLVEKLPVVHDAADGRLRGRRNLNQVQILLAGHFERLEGGQDADLCALVIDHANFACADALVCADKTFIDTILRALQAETLLEKYSMGPPGSQPPAPCVLAAQRLPPGVEQRIL
jgi:hypothetical protein